MCSCWQSCTRILHACPPSPPKKLELLNIINSSIFIILDRTVEIMNSREIIKLITQWVTQEVASNLHFGNIINDYNSSLCQGWIIKHWKQKVLDTLNNLNNGQKTSFECTRVFINISLTFFKNFSLQNYNALRILAYSAKPCFLEHMSWCYICNVCAQAKCSV